MTGSYIIMENCHLLSLLQRQHSDLKAFYKRFIYSESPPALQGSYLEAKPEHRGLCKESYNKSGNIKKHQ